MPISEFFSRRPPIILKAGTGVHFNFLGTRASVGIHPGLNLQRRNFICELGFKLQLGLDGISPDQIQGFGLHKFVSIGHHNGRTPRSEDWAIFYEFGKTNGRFYNQLGGKVLFHKVPLVNGMVNDAVDTGFLNVICYSKKKHMIDCRLYNFLIGISGTPSKSYCWLTDEFVPGMIAQPIKLSRELSALAKQQIKQDTAANYSLNKIIHQMESMKKDVKTNTGSLTVIAAQLSGQPISKTNSLTTENDSLPMAVSIRDLAANNKIAALMVVGVGIISGLLYAFCDYSCHLYYKKQKKSFKDHVKFVASYIGIFLNPIGPVFATIICIGHFLIGKQPFFVPLQTSPLFAPLQTSPTMSLVGSLSVEKPDKTFKEKTFLNTIIFDAPSFSFSAFFTYRRVVFLITVCLNGRSFTIMFASHTVFTICRLTLSRMYLAPIEKREFNISDIRSFFYQAIKSSFFGFVGIYGLASMYSSGKSQVHYVFNSQPFKGKKVNDGSPKDPEKTKNDDLIKMLEKKQTESEK